MNLLGKSLVVAIFVMSLVFMSFAMAVYTAHVNWFNVVNRPREEAGLNAPLGLKYQLQDAQQANDNLTAEVQRLVEDSANETNAQQQVIAKLENEKNLAEEDNRQLQGELDNLNQQIREQAEAINSSHVTLAQYRDELLGDLDAGTPGLRREILDVQEDRDEQFNTVVDITDQLHQAETTLKRLKAENQQLTEQIARMQLVFQDHKINPFVESDPRVDGRILASRANGLVEISVGSDDGIYEGSVLDVTRGNRYLGRIEVVRADPDKAVAKIVPAFHTGAIQVGDRVTTRFG